MRLQTSMNIADQIVSFRFSSMIYATKQTLRSLFIIECDHIAPAFH
jgi:hypothetical protein